MASPRNAAQSDPYIVPALERGIRLLSLFSQAEPELSALEVTRRLELSHATVYRLLHTFEHAGMLRRTAGGYTLGARILTLGYEYLSSQSIVELARPALERLRDETDTSANMGVLDGREVIYIAHAPSKRPLASRMQVGSRFPAYTASIGRLLLGALPENELTKLFTGVILKPLNPESPTSLAALRKLVAADFRRGYVISRGIFDDGLIAVAAPIFDHTGLAVAGVNVSGPASAFSAAELKGRVKDGVRNAAARISALLGYPNS